MSDDLVDFPRGQVSFGAGKLKQAITARVSLTNNAKLKHTLRRSPAGTCRGVFEAKGQIESEIDETGMERDYFDAVKSGAKKQFRYELPAKGLVIEGVVETVDAELPLDDAIKVTASWIGKMIFT